MLEEIIQSPEQFSLDEGFADFNLDDFFNFDYESDLHEEVTYSTKISSPTKNIVSSSTVSAKETFPAIDAIFPEPHYDNSLNSPNDSSELLPSILFPPSPPKFKSKILQSHLVLPMAPMNPASQLNPMMYSAPYTSFSPGSVLSKLPFYSNGGIGVEPYANGIGMPTCSAQGKMGIFAGHGMEVRPKEGAEACRTGIYSYGSMPAMYCPNDLKVLGKGQHLMASCSNNTAPLKVPPDIPKMDDSKCKVSRLSTEERKEKIHKYLKKRKERNFSKKIKYACRKTLADSRPRVRGRFAKNDEFSEVVIKPSFDNHEYYHEEIELMDKEDELLSSDILVHISGLNSFSYDYPVEFGI